MTLHQFNNLTVNKLVRITVKGRNVPIAWGAASKINRTAKTIKPFGSNKWYSYRHISVNPKPGMSFGAIWGVATPQAVIEQLIPINDLAKL